MIEVTDIEPSCLTYICMCERCMQRGVHTLFSPHWDVEMQARDYTFEDFGVIWSLRRWSGCCQRCDALHVGELLRVVEAKGD